MTRIPGDSFLYLFLQARIQYTFLGQCVRLQKLCNLLLFLSWRKLLFWQVWPTKFYLIFSSHKKHCCTSVISTKGTKILLIWGLVCLFLSEVWPQLDGSVGQGSTSLIFTALFGANSMANKVLSVLPSPPNNFFALLCNTKRIRWFGRENSFIFNSCHNSTTWHEITWPNV